MTMTRARKVGVRLVFWCECCWCWPNVSMIEGVKTGIDDVGAAEVEVVGETGLRHAPRGDASGCLHGGPPTNAAADAPWHGYVLR